MKRINLKWVEGLEKKCGKYFDGLFWFFSSSYIPKEGYRLSILFHNVDLKDWGNIFNRSKKFFSYVERYGYGLKEIGIREEMWEGVEIRLDFFKKRVKMREVLKSFWGNFGSLLKLVPGRITYFRIGYLGDYVFTFHSSDKGYLGFQFYPLARLQDLITAFILGVVIMEGVSEKGIKGYYLDVEEVKRLSKILEGESIEEMYIHLKLLKGLK